MMPAPSRIREAYQQAQPAVGAVQRYVTHTMRPWCDKHHYLFASRIKDLESLAEKIETGRYARWSDLDDLYACTVVVPTATHEIDVLNFIKAAFEIVEIRERNSTKKAPDVFRFDSTRCIARITEEASLRLLPGVDSINFEVQIQTAFEYAWSVVTHDLVYKSEDIDWRKARLVAQLKAAVEQIELIIAGFEASVDFVAQSSHPESDAKRALIQAFKELISEGVVSAQLTPHSWSRFADNVYALVQSYVRSGSQAPYQMNSVTNKMVQHLRGNGEAAALMSGSLFQVVLGCINAGIVSSASFNNFIVVDSPELRDFHRIQKVPRPFIFD